MLHIYTHIQKAFSVYLLLIISILPVPCQAVTDPPLKGARSWGMAAHSVTLTDAWACWNNPGGLAKLQSSIALAGYDIPFGMKGLQTMGLGYVHPLKTGVAGIVLSRFGDELYQIHTLGLSYSQVLEHIQLGLRIAYQQTGIKETALYHTFSADLGAIATLIPQQLTMGIQIHLPVTHSPARTPPRMQTGLCYTPVSTLLLVADIEKEMDYPATVRVGVEYEVVRNVFLRTGIGTQPNLYTFGVGIHPHKLHLDYAVRTHPVLGLSHQLSLGLIFRHKRTSTTPAS